MNDVAELMVTNSVPQIVNFGIEGDVAARVLRVNGIEPKTGGAAAPLITPQIAAGGRRLRQRRCACSNVELVSFPAGRP